VTTDTLALRNEQEKVLLNPDGSVAQVGKYLHGVGDSSNFLIRLLGGTLGVGIISRIVRGYTFISRHYTPGDEIHIVGFSRGAYTARALAGMIARIGLLNPHSYDANDKKQAYQLGVAAWCKSKGVTLHGAGKLSVLATRFLDFVQGFYAEQLHDDALIPDVDIKSVAVWDTVGSMGIPVYEKDMRFDMFRFADTSLSPRVEHGFHAMAIDELRIDFPVTRWDERKGIAQVWFPGAHADVGGGYPKAESGLSDIALTWMTEQLAAIGMAFATPLTGHIAARGPRRRRGSRKRAAALAEGGHLSACRPEGLGEAARSRGRRADRGRTRSAAGCRTERAAPCALSA
jgi:glutathione S-transferase